MSERFPNDVDPIETRDWLQAIESVIKDLPAPILWTTNCLLKPAKAV